MLNKSPIFVNGFSFGGTNLVMNLLASHPDVCWLSGETHEVFQSKPNKVADKLIRELFYLPIKAVTRQNIFGRECLDKRNRIPRFMMNYIDLIFYIDKLTTKRNEYKSEDVRYVAKEIRNSRFLAKNVNGTVIASELFSKMYPDATFISLVRNGFALCEGYVRRGWKAEEVGRMYEIVCQKMISDSRTLPNYHIVHFEKMVSDPLNFMKKIYEYAGLDIEKVKKVRLQAKKSMDKNGTRKYTFGGTRDRETHWFSLEEIGNYIREDVNQNQMEQLSLQDREVFLMHAKGSMELLGYL